MIHKKGIGALLALYKFRQLISDGAFRVGIPIQSKSTKLRALDHRPDVLIAGATASVATLSAVLVAMGFNPIGVFSRSGAVSLGSNVVVNRKVIQAFASETGIEIPDQKLILQVLTAEDFVQKARNGNLPIFIDDIALDSSDHFVAELRYIQYRLRLFENRILHPAALAGLYQCHAKTYMFAGFPSSGNMVFQRCLDGVLAENLGSTFVARSKFERLLSHYALSHWYTLGNLFQSFFQDDGVWQSLAAPCGFGAGAAYLAVGTSANGASPNERSGVVCISGAPMWHHTWANPYHASHEAISPKAAVAYRARNVSCIQIIRHPLDVLVSNAGKIAGRQYSKAHSHIRNHAVISIMNYEPWVESMLDALESYYCALAAAKDQIDYLRYEDLLSNPVPTLQKMATLFDCTISYDAALEIWQRWDGAPAVSAGHRWDPRAGKWKEFVPPRFAGRIIGSKLESAAKEFGYSIQCEDFQGPPLTTSQITVDESIMAMEEGRYHVLVDKEVVVTHDQVYMRRDPQTSLFAAGPVQTRSSINRLLDSNVTKDVMAAATCDDISPIASAACTAARWKKNMAVPASESYRAGRDTARPAPRQTEESFIDID